MVGMLLLLAVAAAPQSAQAPTSSFRPTSAATAHATARITVVSGAKFGRDYASAPSAGQRRSAQLTDYAGQVSPAELLEFQ